MGAAELERLSFRRHLVPEAGASGLSRMAEPGALCKVLLRLYTRGDLPATSVQILAAAAWADGWGRGDSLAERLKSAVQDGTHKGNITRDIVDGARAAGLTSSSAVPYYNIAADLGNL